MPYFKTIVVLNQDNLFFTTLIIFSKLLIIRYKQNLACQLE